ncbi:MAG: tyrosine recombinase XerC [Hydrogenoanaerobacterium sp.]
MNNNILEDCPQIIRDFLFYMETIKGRSVRTVEAYYIDLRTFLRFMKLYKNIVPKNANISEIKISDVNIDFIKSISLSDIYEFLNYTISERENNAKTRSRKISSLRSFYKYLTTKANLLTENPVLNLEVPATKKALPKYLSLEESLALLTNIDGKDKARDYCIITLFLNCGLRLSELVGINISDIKDDNTLKVTGKGNKERILYLNDACLAAIDTYKKLRPAVQEAKSKNAFFISRQGKRICGRRVEQIVDMWLKAAGLNDKGYSAHKLRHTAATLMYQHGGVDIRLLQDMLGHANLGTTEIYTHISSTQLENAAKKNPLSGVKQRNIRKIDSDDEKKDT